MKKKVNFFNMKNKLIIFLLLIIIVPYIFIVNHIDNQFTMYLENELNYTAKNDMVKIDNLINVYIKTLEDNIEFLANNQLVKNSDSTITNYLNTNEKIKMTPSKNLGIEQEIYNLYSNLGESNSSLKYVYMGMENGSFIQWPEGYINEKYDPRVRPWYKAALENSGEVVITDPYYYSSGDVTVISIVKTIQNDKKQIIGVQGIDLSLQKITDIVRNFKVGQTGYLILTDKNGTIIANPNNPEMNFRSVKELNSEVFFNIEKIESDIFDAKLDGTEKIINIYTSEKTNFKLISVVEKKELLGQVNNIEQNIFIVFGIFALIAIIIALIFSNQFSKPILIMKNHLNYISYGDFTKDIPLKMLKRKDEIGDLSIALESMQNRLENLINEIKKSEEEVKEREHILRVNQEKISKLLKLKEIMLQIGYFTNESFNANELFKLILDKVMECTGMGSHGTIFVLDNNNKLRIAVATGYCEEGIEDFSLDLENSIGWIFTEGHIDKTIIVNNIDDIKQINIIDTVDGLKIKSVISAPIIVDDKLFGFINLDNSNYNAFSETEFELMEYIRFQLAVTISKYKLYEETIYLSKYDKLTNLYNRNYFEQLVYTDISESIKERKEMHVVILDLNGLKFVNDNYGHLAGDKFIINFAGELKNCGNGSDIIARFGGDEFIGVIYNRSLDNLTNCLENLIKNFQDNPICFENKRIMCSFSYGISSFPEDGDDFNNLVKIADERMYEYKRKSKLL